MIRVPYSTSGKFKQFDQYMSWLRPYNLTRKISPMLVHASRAGTDAERGTSYTQRSKMLTCVGQF